jgi:hypothetical protein
MSQTGFTPIQLYYSSTTTNTPLAASLANGELAINITDGKLFYKDNAAAVQVIGWKVRPANAGGTGQTAFAIGDLLYADTTTTLAKLADVATGNALISGGISTAPSWGKIGLTTHVSGILPVANGGTNASSASITAFNNITGYTATGATGTTSTNLVFSTSPTITTPTLAGDVNLSTGNITQGTAGKGTNFTANTPVAGMTSQLLNWYEEGTWTPAGNGISFSSASGRYTRIGRQVTCTFTVTFPTTASGSNAQVTGLPFTAGANTAVALAGYTSGINAAVNGATTFVYFGNSTGTAYITNATLSTQVITGSVTYSV